MLAQSDARGNNVGRQIELCVTSIVLRDRRAISNMHNYYYCTPERRGYWSRLSAIHEKPVVVRLESALTSDLKQPRTTVVITVSKTARLSGATPRLLS